MKYIAIDPGLKQSGYVTAEDYTPLTSGIISNKKLAVQLEFAGYRWLNDGATVIIEKPICRKWSGAEVSETAIWTGILIRSWPYWEDVVQVTRQKVRMRTVGKKANDSSIRRYLIERFPQYEEEFKLFKADIWQAYALLVVYLDEKGASNG